MGKNRPIVIATLGYIIGIIWGLYLEINIVFFYAIILVILKVVQLIKKQKKKQFKFISIQKILRYIKLILDFKSIITIIVISSISNFIVTNSNNKYETLYSDMEEISCIAQIVSNGTKKEYKTTYKIKVETLNNSNKYKGTYLYLDVNNRLNIKLNYGDYISLKGSFVQPAKATNYQSFDYSKYLRSQKVYGTIKLEKVYILEENTNNIFCTISNNIFLQLKETIQENLSQEKANLLLGILFGYKEEISEEMQNNFKESNISHVLAVSGLHVTYIILVITNILEKVQGKRGSKYVIIFFIIAYMFITNFSPSVVRAGLMGIITILAKLTYNKNDLWTSIAASLLVLLICNPYLITTAGVLLSYGGTIGIILFQKNVSNLFQKLLDRIDIFKYQTNSKVTKLISYVKNTISVSVAAQLAIAPIMLKMFNTISFSFFITNFFVSIIIGPIIMFGFLFLISHLIKITILEIIFKFILEKILEILIFISQMGTKLPLSKIYLSTPRMWQIILYYLAIFVFSIIYKISNQIEVTTFEKRLINWKNLIKHIIRNNYKKVVPVIVCILLIFFCIQILPKDLRTHFVDVGQGDCTLVITPGNKTILIDGGGSENYDVGENVLLPYLLDRGITQIDYMIISHFDTDHVGGLLGILQELEVKIVLISKQGEDSENFGQFIQIVKDRKIKVIVVKKR